MLRSYTPADIFTLANASCGTISIFLCLSYIADSRSGQLWAAFVLPVVALAFDVMDGYVARRDPRRQSLLGADLDSLADIVSFGVAPAVLGYTLGLRGGWDVLVLTYFVCSGISRLARFNVTAASLTNEATGKVRYFEGTPIPTSVVLVLLLAFLWPGANRSELSRGAMGTDGLDAPPLVPPLLRERQPHDQHRQGAEALKDTAIFVSAGRSSRASPAVPRGSDPRLGGVPAHLMTSLPTVSGFPAAVPPCGADVLCVGGPRPDGMGPRP